MTRYLGPVTLSNGIKVPELLVSSGTSVCIVGASNVGKTEYCQFALGYPQNQTYAPEYPEPDPVSIGYVPTNPLHVFSGIKSTLRGEFELTYQFLAREPEDFLAFADIFELGDKLDQDPFTLSGGEAVKAAVAMIAAKRPTFWVLDQVYDALAPATRIHMRNYFEGCIKKGAGVLETHSRAPAWISGSKVCMLDPESYEGITGSYDDLVAKGTPDTLLRPETRLQHAKPRTPDDRNSETNVADRSDEISIFDLCEEPKELTVSDVSFTYPNSSFELSAPSLTIRSNECTCLIGPNGAGKTTLLRLVAGLLKPVSGSVEIDERTPKGAWEWAREILYSFQNPDDQIYHATVRNEVYSTSNILKRKPLNPDLILETLDLTDDLEKSPSELALPKRRIVTIASALMASPPFIALDEPTSALDEVQMNNLLSLLRIYRSEGGSIVIVSHDLDFMGEIADRLVLVEDGRIDTTLTPETWPAEYAPFAFKTTKSTPHQTASFQSLLRRQSNG